MHYTSMEIFATCLRALYSLMTYELLASNINKPFFTSWLMLVTCAPDSNNLMGVNTFCQQIPLLKWRWQLQRLFEQGNKHFVLALA